MDKINRKKVAIFNILCKVSKKQSNSKSQFRILKLKSNLN